METRPLYSHYCDSCEFIQNLTVEGVKYDVYRCTHTSIGESTWLARYGDEDGNYWSMPWDVMKTVDTDVDGSALLREMLRIAAKHEKRR